MECHAFRGMLGFLALALGCSEAPPSKPGSSQGIPVSSAGSGAGLSAGGSSAGGQSGGLGESPAVGEGGATSNIVTGPNGETLLLLADAEGGPDAGGTFADPTYGFTGYWYMYNDETLGATQVLTYDPADRTSYAAHTNGSGFTTWGAGIGLNFDLPIDATQFSGIGFWIKLGGSPHQVRFSAVNGQVELPADGGTCDETLGICSDKFGSSLKTLDGSWKFVKFKWSELRQEGWGQRFEAMDPSSFLGFQFSVVKNFPFDFWLDDISLIIDDPTVAAPDPPPATPGGYHVVGNQVLTGDGTPYLFHGMHRPSLEWAEVGDNQSKEDFELMKSWGANVVRMGLNQAFWLRSPGYKDTVDQNVRWAQASGLDVILDLHWSDRGEDGVAAQQRMADKNSLIFWQELADIYKDNQRILFELYNEPHHVTWDVWRDGGDSGDGFEAVGMQDMYDVVRATGAQNLVLIGGIDYAYDLSGVATHAVTGDNIIYASHPYDTKERLPDNWPTAWAYLAPTYPLMLSEFGLIDVWGLAPGTCNDSAYVQQAIDYANQLKVSWAGYAWYPEPDLSRPCSFPSLINDWTGTPSPIGVIVKTELGKLK